MTKKQLRADIYHELFDTMRLAPMSDETLDERCYRMTGKIMAHVEAYISKEDLT